MKRIDIVDGILYYYGNPAGCVSGETAILDTMFQKEELIRFLTEKGIENPVFRGGVYDQLSEDSGTEKTITIDRKESKKFRIYQLGQKSPVTMRFISLAERRKRGYDRPQRGEYVLVHEEKIEKFNLEEVWEKYGQAVPENFEGHPDLLLMATRLMHHLGNVIEENMDGGKKGGNRQRMDRKLARKIRQKKIAQGHAEDDREQQMM